jgi:hypothetical protein
MYYFWIVVVFASDPKGMFVKHVTMFIVQIIGLIWVCLVE